MQLEVSGTKVLGAIEKFYPKIVLKECPESYIGQFSDALKNHILCLQVDMSGAFDFMSKLSRLS